MIVTDPFSSAWAKPVFTVTCWRKVPFFFTWGSDWDFLEDIALCDLAGAYDSGTPAPPLVAVGEWSAAHFTDIAAGKSSGMGKLWTNRGAHLA